MSDIFPPDMQLAGGLAKSGFRVCFFDAVFNRLRQQLGSHHERGDKRLYF